jgi:[ribosomal protein S18]-alanine N-acetyltransferase
VTVRLTELTRADCARCAELEAELFPGDDPWSERVFAGELRQQANHYFGARTEDDRLVGYAGLSVNGRKGDRETSVHTIGVDPAHQGRGVGTALLRALLAIADDEAAPVFLEVRTDNAAAIRLYERHGFARLGVRRHYYQPSGADAYTMGRPPTAERAGGSGSADEDRVK